MGTLDSHKFWLISNIVDLQGLRSWSPVFFSSSSAIKEERFAPDHCSCKQYIYLPYGRQRPRRQVHAAQGAWAPTSVQQHWDTIVCAAPIEIEARLSALGQDIKVGRCRPAFAVMLATQNVSN